MATVPELDPPQVAELGNRLRDNVARAVKAPEENARVLRGVLAGQPGTERALAVLNAAAAIYVGGRADSLREGVVRAEESIDSGAAAAKLDRYLEFAR